MTWNELIRKIERAGWKLDREASGSHRVYRHADHPEPLVIAYHANKEVRPGLMHALLRKAGIK
jgi:predicted RNA binding protein YcfA (HicA-like mRNA interferase family)